MGTEEKSLITDLNDRERKRYAVILDGVIDSAQEAKKSIVEKKDTTLLINLMAIALQFDQLRELRDVFMTALEARDKQKENKTEADHGPH